MKRIFFIPFIALVLILASSTHTSFGQTDSLVDPLDRLSSSIEEASELLEIDPYEANRIAQETLYEISRIRANGYMAPDDPTPISRNAVMKREIDAYYICAQAAINGESFKEANRYIKKGFDLSIALNDMDSYETFNQLQQEVDWRISSNKKGLGRFLHSKGREIGRKVAEELSKVEDDVTENLMENAESKARENLYSENLLAAGHHYLEALQYADKLNDSLRILEYQTQLASIYMDLGRYEEARQVAESDRRARIADSDYSFEEGENEVGSLEKDDVNEVRPIEIGKPKPIDPTFKSPVYEELAKGLKTENERPDKTEKTPRKLTVSQQLARLEASIKRKWEDSIMAAEFISKNQAEIKKLRFESRLDSLMLEDKELALREKRNQISYFVVGFAAIIAIALLLYILFSYQKRVNKKLKIAYDQLKSAQLQLVESEKMASLGQLTAGVAHEINNPVNFISGNVLPLRRDMEDLVSVLDSYEDEITRQGLQDHFTRVEQEKNRLDLAFVKEEIKQLLEGIEEGASRTAEIVKELRNFVRMDEISPKLFDIHQGLDSTLSLLKHQTEGVEIVKSYSELPQLVCLPGKLNQVFMNLLSNALQADSTEVHVSTSLMRHAELSDSFSNGAVHIEVRDNGKGIPKEIMPYIFDPFYTTKDVGEGTGLGLSISKGIVEQHEGKLHIESAEGKGTTVQIYLPVGGMEESNGFTQPTEKKS